MIIFPKNVTLSGPQVGKPVNRVDGLAKVTGQAKYAAEFAVPDLLYGFVVLSTIARGRIVTMDLTAAKAVPGVVDILTHSHRPRTSWWTLKWKDQDAPPGSPFRPLQDEKILFSDQPIALIVARTSELARHAASLVQVTYEEQPHATDLRKHRSRARPPSSLKFGFSPPPKPRGDADEAYRTSAVQIDAEYSSPVEHHNALEMHASTVVYGDGGALTIYDKTQGVTNSHGYVARVFGLAKKKIRVLSPFVGGAFGSALRPQYQLFLAVAAALTLKRSVRVVLTRQQTFGLGHRPETLQRIALGADAGGRLQAVIHEVVGSTSRFEDYVENVANWSTLLYRCETARQSYDVVPLDIFTPLDMRAPGGALGVFAIETAIDELAHKAGIDPLEIRLRNYADRDGDNDLPFSSKELKACYAQASERFGWSRRSFEPRSMKDGHRRVGWGMATGVWEAMQMPAGAKAVLQRDGRLVVSTATADIGTGTYTVMSQIAADAFGLPLDRVTIELGDSDLPFALVEGGSWTAGSVGTAVMAVCAKLGKTLCKKASELARSPLKGVSERDLEIVDGGVQIKRDPTRRLLLSELAARYEGELEMKAMVLPHMLDQRKFARYTHSAVFAEVHVDEDFGTVRVNRMVTAVAAGRILNPKTARSQILGGMVWGVGMALSEETVTDRHFGRYMNHSLAEYHLPVHADMGDFEVLFVPEEDGIVNPIGVKGLGEIGIVGVAAAISNAVFHATGKRVRDLPITLDKVM